MDFICICNAYYALCALCVLLCYVIVLHIAQILCTDGRPMEMNGFPHTRYKFSNKRYIHIVMSVCACWCKENERESTAECVYDHYWMCVSSVFVARCAVHTQGTLHILNCYKCIRIHITLYVWHELKWLSGKGEREFDIGDSDGFGWKCMCAARNIYVHMDMFDGHWRGIEWRSDDDRDTGGLRASLSSWVLRLFPALTPHSLRTAHIQSPFSNARAHTHTNKLAFVPFVLINFIR